MADNETKALQEALARLSLAIDCGDLGAITQARDEAQAALTELRLTEALANRTTAVASEVVLRQMIADGLVESADGQHIRLTGKGKSLKAIKEEDEAKAEARFREAYERLSKDGHCDDVDPRPFDHPDNLGESRRVWEEWNEAGRPADVEAFIRERANVGPQKEY